MRTMILLISLLSGSAFAAVDQNSDDGISRAFQQAQSVAVMENGRTLPSRALWIGQRVVQNSKALAYQLPKGEAKRIKKNTATQ